MADSRLSSYDKASTRKRTPAKPVYAYEVHPFPLSNDNRVIPGGGIKPRGTAESSSLQAGQSILARRQQTIPFRNSGSIGRLSLREKTSRRTCLTPPARIPPKRS